MTESTPPPPPPPMAAPRPPSNPPPQGRGCWFYGCLITGVLLMVIATTVAVTAWQVKRSINAKPITPTELTVEEQAELDTKIEIFGRSAQSADDPRELTPADAQELEPVDEDFVRKPLIITEREINALIANNTDLGDKVYITLDNDSLKLKVNYPVEEGTPFVGGKTLRLAVRTRIALEVDRLDIRVTNVSMGGLPLPSSWLEGVGLHDVNLVEDFATDDKAMKTLVDGIESLEIEDGQIVLMLAE